MLRFIDSFDHYQTGQITAKWTSITAGVPQIVPLVGRCGTQALQPAINSFQDLLVGIPFASSKVTIGMAVNYQVQLFSSPYTLYTIENSLAEHLAVKRALDGSIRIERNGTLLGTTAPNAIQMFEYSYLEVQVLISATVGTIEVRINGSATAALHVTGLNTQGSGTGDTTVTAIRVVGQSNYIVYIDDLYALDDTGATNNTFLGDTHVEYLHPVAAGAHQDWSVVGLPTHWQAVSDGAFPDDDTSYIATTTVNAIDTEIYQQTGLPAGTIFGVQIGLYARKTDSGLRSCAPVVRQGGNDFVGTSQAPSATSYRYMLQIYETDPATSAAWTIADVNAAEYGVKLTG